MAAIAALVLRLFTADSFGAENVAPTKAELEEITTLRSARSIRTNLRKR